MFKFKFKFTFHQNNKQYHIKNKKQYHKKTKDGGSATQAKNLINVEPPKRNTQGIQEQLQCIQTDRSPNVSK